MPSTKKSNNVARRARHADGNGPQARRLSKLDMQREAISGLVVSGSRADPFRIAVHMLHVDSYVRIVHRQLEGEGLISARFVLRMDDTSPVTEAHCFVEQERSLVSSFLTDLAALRKMLFGTDA